MTQSPDVLPDITLDNDARAIIHEAAQKLGRSPNFVVTLAVSALLGYPSALNGGDKPSSPPPPPRPVKTKVLVNGPHAFEIRECEFHWVLHQLKSATLQLQHVERGTMFPLTIPVGWQWDKITAICSALIHSPITDPSQLIGCQLDFICSNGKPIRLPK
jgi:hypothetical protein